MADEKQRSATTYTETVIATGDVADAFAVAQRQALKRLSASVDRELTLDDLVVVERSEDQGWLRITWRHEFDDQPAPASE